MTEVLVFWKEKHLPTRVRSPVILARVSKNLQVKDYKVPLYTDVQPCYLVVCKTRSAPYHFCTGVQVIILQKL